MANWPNLFIAGAPRCGTSSLDGYLRAIPGIYMSRIKEPNYFSRVVFDDQHPRARPIRDQAAYLALFADGDGAKFRGEASPNYLDDPQAPDLIDRTVPGARVIVSLRDPVERLFSHYLMMRNNRAVGSFAAEIERGLALAGQRRLDRLVLETGLYAANVERYRSIFGPRFKVLIFEEWMADVPRTIRELLEFLGLEYDVTEVRETAQRRHSEVRSPIVRYVFGNRVISRAAESLIPFKLRKFLRNTLLTKAAPKPQMDGRSREVLIGYYRDDVRRLERLLDRRLPWPNFSDAEASRGAG